VSVLSRLSQRRLANFRSNRRAFVSLIIFLVLFGLSLLAEFIANDQPLLVSYRDTLHAPIFTFHSERDFGGDLDIAAAYREPEITCLIMTGGLIDCYDDPLVVMEDAEDGVVNGSAVEAGWILWPPLPYSYTTVVNLAGTAPSPPDRTHLLGTDDTARDVLARIIYGFRLSILFTVIVTLATTILGVTAGLVQGYFGGLIDLLFQRLIEIWGATPALYIIIIVAAIWQMNFWLLALLMTLFGWTALVGVVRAECLRARNFEYVLAARALGVTRTTIMFRHVLPNAMVATLTLLPFVVTGTIGSLAALDFLGFGLQSSAPSLGELTQQAKNNLQAPWLGITAFLTFTIMLSLLVFIFEGVRDAFDPRKTQP